MTSGSRGESRKAMVSAMSRAALMRTAATALVVASPFVYSGASASAATTPRSTQLTAPLLQARKTPNKPLIHSLAWTGAASGTVQLTAPLLEGRTTVKPIFVEWTGATSSSAQLIAPRFHGISAPTYTRISDQPVQDLLAVPMDAKAGNATISASAFSVTPMAAVTPLAIPGPPLVVTDTGSNPIDVTNSSDYAVSDTEAAIDLQGETGDVTLVNTGDLTGGGGISATTGAFDINTAPILSTSEKSETFNAGYRNFYNEFGQYVSWSPTVHYTANYTRIDVNGDNNDSTVSVDNQGRIAFSGTYGIKAANATGASATITNSGDIAATSDTDRRSGIYATVRNPSTNESTYDVINPGEFTYNADGYLTGVTEFREVTSTGVRTMKHHDGGIISITNSGNIDMGETVLTHFVYDAAPWSTAIEASGDGGITIINSGDLKVGDSSQGIRATANGNVTINNSGNIEIGNGGRGIFTAVTGAFEPAGYRLSGDVTIINTGDIRGGMTRAEAEASENLPYFDPSFMTVVYGMSATNLGSNNEYVAGDVVRNRMYSEYNAALEEAGEPYRFAIKSLPDAKLYTTELTNYGTIELKDGARGIHLQVHAGYANAINRGTIIVGDGASDFEGNTQFAGTGILNHNARVNGVSDLYSLNAKDAIIVTGDDGAGIDSYSWLGNSTAINAGSITVGDGVFKRLTDFNGVEFDQVMPSHGMVSVVGRYGMGTQSVVINSGDIAVGDLAIGAASIGSSYLKLFSGKATGVAFNEGHITAGNNSSGIYVAGTNTVAENAANGTIIIGDRDLSGFEQGAYGLKELAQVGYGMMASSSSNSRAFNDGSITTGDGTVGIAAAHLFWQKYGLGQSAAVYQGETGIVSTGDYSTGALVNGTRSSYLLNAGTINTGSNSTGAEVKGGAAYFYFTGELVDSPGTNCAPIGEPAALCQNYVSAVAKVPVTAAMTNAGIIETGDESVGVRVAGVKNDVPYSGYNDILTGRDADGFYTGYRKYYAGTVDVIGSALLANSGTIRVGANSTAVEITGKGITSPLLNPAYDATNPISQPYIPNPDYVPGDPSSDPYIANPVYDPENPISQPYLRNPAYDPSDVDSEPYLMGNSLPQLINTGTIDAGHGVAIKANVDNGINTKIDNSGTIIGDIQLGAGDDYMRNAGGGNIIMNNSTIDFGDGDNRFAIKSGVISVAGGDDNWIIGSNLTVEMEYGEIDARDIFVGGPISLAAVAPLAVPPFSTLTIDGNVSGSFRFAADVNAAGQSDELIITGDVADGSEIGVVVNLLDPFKGDLTFAPIHIGGSNGADVMEVAGASGFFADSFVGGEAHFDQASGDVIVTATFGLGHMGTAANAASILAQDWLTTSLGSHNKRNIGKYSGRKGDGFSVWGYAFQDEGRINPSNGLQNLSFSQVLWGAQGGVTWSQEAGDGHISVSPMFTYGTAEANLRATTSSARGKPWAFGLNANYVLANGFYVDATYQNMRMDVDFKTPQTLTQAKGDTRAKGQGVNLEVGYAHKLQSGLTLEPQLQLSHVKVDLDDFDSSDGIYQLTDIGGKSSTLRAGLSAYETFETTSGSITPFFALSYLNALNGKGELMSNGLDFDSDTSGSGYLVEGGVTGRYKGLDVSARVGLSDTSATGSILQPSLSLRYSWGGAKATTPLSAAADLPDAKLATVKFAENQSFQGPAATAASASLQSSAPPALMVAASAQETARPTEEPAKQEQATPESEEQATPQAAEQPDGLVARPGAEATDDNQEITVTGTLIRRSTASEATPITVVTSEEMATRGLMTLGEVLNSFTQNEGFVQGKSSNLLGRFTFGAEEVNFRGLGAGRTLVLVNGRRIADYPLPFGGEQNGVDLGTIPYSAIAKVEYLSAGASATYGSDAVGGVLNIITKRDMEQTAVELNGGIYQQGFGETGRAAFITGNSFARGSFTVGVEGYYSGDILASDVKFFRKNAPYSASMVSIVENSAGGQNPVVPASACAPLGFEFSNGQCSSEISDTISLSPTVKQGSAFFDGRYDLTDRIELFGTAMASVARAKTRSNVLFWDGIVADGGADGVIGVNPDTNVNDDGNATFITRGFSEDELGVSTIDVDNNMWTVVGGAKGGIDVGNDVWYWDVAVSHASFNTKQTSINLKEEGIRNWILAGAATATDFPDQRYTYVVDPGFYNGQLIDNIVRPVQPADVDALIGKNIMKASSTAQSVTATLNGTFGDLGVLYKPVKFAVRAEYGHQVTKIDPDERTLNTTGQGWFNIGAIEAKGERDRWAVAAEVDAAVLSNLDVVLAARYDHYDDASSITGRVTGQAKFLYRPTDWLKVRGGYGQTFRAPDMFNIYGQSSGFEVVPDFSATTDGTLNGPPCFDGSTYVCGGFQIASTRQADPRLKEEHGDDLGLGIILNPIPGFQMTADWYSIHLKDLVLTEASFDLLLKEWQCNNDVLETGSALCADVRSRVIRNGAREIERVIIRPINQSKLTRSGIDIQASYDYESAKLGAFHFNLGYSKVLKFELTRFAGDDSIDLTYGEPGASTPANSLNAGLSWFNPLTTGKAIAAGIFVQRSGRVYNFDHTQFLEPFYDVNLSAAYQMNTRTSLRLNVNNVLNTKPQDNGGGIWPYYWAHLQSANALGRSAYVSLSHSFN